MNVSDDSAVNILLENISHSKWIIIFQILFNLFGAHSQRISEGKRRQKPIVKWEMQIKSFHAVSRSSSEFFDRNSSSPKSQRKPSKVIGLYVEIF